MKQKKQKTHKTEEDEKLVSLSNRQNMQTQMNPHSKKVMTAHEQCIKYDFGAYLIVGAYILRLVGGLSAVLCF